MVCQRLALIMGFVSVCLRKWHARVRRCVPVLVCVAACKAEHIGKEKSIYVQVIILFSRG